MLRAVAKLNKKTAAAKLGPKLKGKLNVYVGDMDSYYLNDAVEKLNEFLVKADNPIGEWNSLTIKMVGTRVWVTLNGKPVVVGQVLDNFFDRAQPVLPTGSIELQTHGSEVRFRNIYVRDIPEAMIKGWIEEDEKAAERLRRSGLIK